MSQDYEVAQSLVAAARRIAELEQELAKAREALRSIDKRLRDCFGHPITAEDAYDSFYQDEVDAAMKEQP